MNSIYRQDRVKTDAYLGFFIGNLLVYLVVFQVLMRVLALKKTTVCRMNYKSKKFSQTTPLLFTSSRESSAVPSKKQGPRQNSLG
jgi:hypothetical protein